jgi:23S rRNA (guanosine2251-2'-O)-methyltransferase
MKKNKLVLIVHDVRSAHNVGSILRSADGFGVDKVYMTGITPYPVKHHDERLPHIAVSTGKKIQKTALGAETTVSWEQYEYIHDLINLLKHDGYEIVALEQTDESQDLTKFIPEKNVAIIAGNEVDGLDASTLSLCDAYIHIPMQGKKESFNVAIALSIAMYHFSNIDN